MKTKTFIILLLISLSTFFVACEDENDNNGNTTNGDTPPPIIYLNGASDTSIALNTQWMDPGATAIDDVDGVVPVTVTGNVNKDLVGNYTLTYKASDSNGNTSIKTRIVRVKNEADTWAGTYTVTDNASGNTYTYTDNISISQTKNKYANVNKFRNYTNCTLELYFTEPITVNTSIIINSQSITCGDPYISRTFFGTGQITSITEHTFELFFNENDGTNTITGVENYQKNN